MDLSIYYARTVIAGAVAGTLGVLWAVDIATVRQRRDPARAWVIAMKATLPLEIMSMLMSTAADAYSLDHGQGPTGFGGPTLVYLRIVASMFGGLGDVGLAVVFIELGNGFMYAINRKRSILQKSLHMAAMFGIVPLVVLNFGLYGSMIDFERKQDHDAGYSALNNRPAETVFFVINFAISICIVVYAGMVMHYYRKMQSSKASARIYLTATVLNLPRWLLYTVYNVSGYKRNDPWSTPQMMTIYSGIDLMVGYICLFISLVLVWVIGIRKTQGLWTTPQPWMEEAPPPMTSKLASSPNDSTLSEPYPQPDVPVSATSSLRRQNDRLNQHSQSRSQTRAQTRPQTQPQTQPQEQQQQEQEQQQQLHLLQQQLHIAPPTAYPHSGVTAPPPTYPHPSAGAPPTYMQHGFVRDDISPEQAMAYNWQVNMQYYQQPYAQYQYPAETPGPPHEVHGDSIQMMGSPVPPNAYTSMDSKP